MRATLAGLLLAVAVSAVRFRCARPVAAAVRRGGTPPHTRRQSRIIASAVITIARANWRAEPSSLDPARRPRRSSADVRTGRPQAAARRRCRRKARAVPSVPASSTGWPRRSNRRLDAAARGAPDPGRPALHRLNRAEYANAIRDLLGLDVDVAALLPPGTRPHSASTTSADAQGRRRRCLQALSVRGARDQRRARSATARIGAGQPDLHRAAGSVAGLSSSTACRSAPWAAARHAHLSRRRRVRLPGADVAHQPAAPSRGLETSARGRAVARRRAAPAGDDRRPRRPGGAADEPDRRLDAIETQRLRRARRTSSAGQRPASCATLSRRDAGGACRPRAAAVHPRLRQPVRRRARAARAVDHRDAARSAPLVRRPAGEPPRVPSAARCGCRGRGTGCVRRIVTALGRRAFRRPLAAADTTRAASTRTDASAPVGHFRHRASERCLRRILASPSFVFRPEVRAGRRRARARYAR